MVPLIDIPFSPERFHPLSSLYGTTFESVCSKPCGIGEFKVRIISMVLEIS
jgi:hypothetical protein